MVVVEAVHVLFCDCFVLICVEGEVGVIFNRGGGVLGGFFDGVGDGFAVVLLRAFDLEAADCVEVVGVALLSLQGVLMGQLLWMAGMLQGLLLMVVRWCGHGRCLLRFFEFWVSLVLGLATCAVSHRFNLNKRRYISLT